MPSLAESPFLRHPSFHTAQEDLGFTKSKGSLLSPKGACFHVKLVCGVDPPTGLLFLISPLGVAVKQ